MTYSADTEGWPVTINDAEGRIVATFNCLETKGMPYLPAKEVYAHVNSFLTLLNTSPSERLAYWLIPPILTLVFTLRIMGAI